MNTHELWQAALGELELALSKAHYTTWFRNTFVSTFDEGKVIVCVPNAFTKAWLEKKYHDAVIVALKNVTDDAVQDVMYKVEVKQSTAQPTQLSRIHEDTVVITQSATSSTPAASTDLASPEQEFSLNPRYTFENFIVGKTNELAHAAAMAVTEKPVRYNPLFVYGGVGLGKTHLLQAIGHKMIEKNPRTRVLYVTCERFTNEFIHAVRSGRGKEFKDTYRNLDLLLLDDIQFITGKEGTQEEFFHTFNALHQMNKQIILSSDRPPKAIQGIEQRIISRLEWGMMVDISTPDLETRVAILESKCSEKEFPLNREIVSFIASKVSSNIRELEGALNKIIAYHQFKNIAPTIESVRDILSSLANSTEVAKRNLTAKHVMDTVADYFDVSIPDMVGKCREKRFAFPRQIIMYLMREELKSSYPTIGRTLGGRDHTTAIHAYTKICREVTDNEKLKHDLTLIRQRLYTTTV